MNKKHELNTRTLTILIVDDKTASLRLLTDILSSKGYRVRPTERPQSAIESAMADPPDLILLDVKMPGMNGFEVCRRLKQEERTKNIPIIFVSGLQDTEDKVRGFKAGGVDFLSKPFQESEILARVDTHLQLRCMQMDLEDRVNERTSELMTSNISLETEITERKKVEDALREGRDYLENLTDSMGDVVVSIDIPGRKIEWINDSYNIFGYDPDECVGKTTEFLYPDRADFLAFGDNLAKFIAEDNDILHTEQIFKRKGGELFSADITITKFRIDNEVVSVTAIVRDITDRKAAERELRKAKINYRMVADYTYDWEWWANPDGTYRYVSPACERITGYKAARFIEDHSLLREIIVPEDREKWDKHDHESGKDIGRREMQFRIKRADGEVRWIEHACQPVFTRENEFLGFRASNRDITERKRVEDDLRISEEKFYKVFQASPASMTITDIGTGKFVDTNPSFERDFGYSREEVIGKSALDINVWKNPAERERLLSRYPKERYAHIPELELVRKSGETAVADVHFCLISVAGNELSFASFIDITERKKAVEALVESEEKFRTLVTDNEEIIYIIDKDGTFVLSEGKGLAKLGLQPGQVVGESVFELYKDYPQMLDSMRNALTGETITTEINVDGNYFSNWYTPHKKQSGEIIGILGLSVNITERKKAELELKKSLAEIKRLKDLHEQESFYLREEINLEHNYKNIIGKSNALQYVLFKVEQVAETDTSVLVLGETGTGKELIARAIHHNSRRKDRPLIKINCATLPANLIESELFGHERGSFTGAHARHAGRFEVADGSSIFLDEIGELPIELQPKLLRVVEDGEFERLGSSRTMKVDVRIIAATNRDLEKDVQAGRFRQDLWYRLNIFPITIPPLRDRVEDIPLIVQYYVDILARKLGKNIASVPVKVVKALQSYSWPGNIRELANVLERAVISTSGPNLSLPEELRQDNQKTSESFKSLRDMERDYIVKVLEKTDWKISGKNSAAEILSLDRSTLRARMKKLGIDK